MLYGELEKLFSQKSLRFLSLVMVCEDNEEY